VLLTLTEIVINIRKTIGDFAGTLCQYFLTCCPSVLGPCKFKLRLILHSSFYQLQSQYNTLSACIA